MGELAQIAAERIHREELALVPWIGPERIGGRDEEESGSTGFRCGVPTTEIGELQEPLAVLEKDLADRTGAKHGIVIDRLTLDGEIEEFAAAARNDESRHDRAGDPRRRGGKLLDVAAVGIDREWLAGRRVVPDPVVVPKPWAAGRELGDETSGEMRHLCPPAGGGS